MTRPLTLRERNPLPFGVIGLLVIAVGLLIAFNLQFFSGGTVYKAAFTEAANLRPGEEVRIAGVRVGKVEKVDLENDHVRVDFTVDDGVRFGARSKAEIKIKTILGAHYLALTPEGAGQQSPDQEIPVSRTVAPYEVVPALSDLAQQTAKIDAKQLAKSFDTLSTTLKDSPEEIQASLHGLQRLSRAVASRDDQLNELLGHSRKVTDVLADRSGDITKLTADGDLLLREVQARRAVISQMLSGTVSLTQQIQGVVKDNEAELAPALKNLQVFVNTLNKHQNDLGQGLELLGEFNMVFTDSVATGRWFDGYLQNVVPLPLSIQAQLGIQNTPGAKAQKGQKTAKPPATSGPGKDNLLPFLQ